MAAKKKTPAWLVEHRAKRDAQQALRDREKEEFAGRLDFPESLTMPRTEDCTVPLYCVVWWDQKHQRECGNSWPSKRKAMQVRDKYERQSCLVRTCTRYCAGFLF